MPTLWDEMAFPRRRLAGTCLAAAAIAMPVAGIARAQDATDPTDPAAQHAPPCPEVNGIANPDDRVLCTTEHAALSVAPEDIPVLLGETQVRVVAADLEGRTITTQLRVRNETAAEQGVSAGGQEIYLNLAGKRIDARPIGVVRVPPRTGITTKVVFDLTPAQRETLSRRRGRIDFGVRPWQDLGERIVAVGVVRLDVMA